MKKDHIMFKKKIILKESWINNLLQNYAVNKNILELGLTVLCFCSSR